MKYYKVQEEKNYWDKKGNYLGFTVKDELITEAEMKKRNFPITKNFLSVEIKKTNIYKSFGCRFEIK